jgi:alpha-N-arabinofuranosidase
VNVLQAMILTDGPKMVLTPTYHVYRMYTPFHDATLVPVAFDPGVYRHGGLSLPAVDAVAAKDSAGKLWVAVTNIDPDRPAEIELGVAGVHARSAAGQVLTADRVDAVNTFDAPDRVSPKPIQATARAGKLRLTVPPKSVAVVAVQE